MIRLIVLAIIVAGFVLSIVIGRIRKLGKYFFWRQVVVLWGCLLVTTGIALAPLKVHSITNVVSNRDIIFVLDTTASMNAVDGREGNEKTRLEDAKTDMHTIVNANAGASFGLYTFSDQTALMLPLTTGADDTATAIDTAYTPTHFNTVNKIVPYKQLFTDLGTYLRAQQQSDPTRQRIVIMLSDFEIFKEKEQANDIVDAANNITNAGAGFVGLVYGTTAGAKMLNMAYDYTNSEFIPSYKLYGDDEATKYLSDNYKTVISKANPELANDIAHKLGGTAVEANKTQDFNGAIAKAAKRSGAIAAKDKQSQSLNQNIFYTIPAFLTFAWLVLTMIARPRWLKGYLAKRSPSKRSARHSSKQREAAS